MRVLNSALLFQERASNHLLQVDGSSMERSVPSQEGCDRRDENHPSLELWNDRNGYARGRQRRHFGSVADAARIDTYVVYPTSVGGPRRNSTDGNISCTCFTRLPCGGSRR